MRAAVRSRRVVGTGAVVRLPERRVSWDEAVDEFLREKRRENCSASTTERIYPWVLRGRAKEWVAEEGFTSVAEIDAEALRRFETALMELDPPLAVRSVHIHHRVIKTFLTFCLERNYLQDHGVTRVKGPRLPDEHPRGFTAQEERLLIAAARQQGERDRVLLLLMLHTGLRRAELAALTIDSLDETVNGDWFLRVRQGKGRKDRIVPLDTGNLRLSDTLREYIRKTRPRDTAQRGLFLTERKIAGGDYSPLGVNGISQLFKRLSAATGFDAHPHRCRHHFATRALAAGLDPESLRRSLGHTTLAMTMKYISASDDDLIQAWKRRKD